MPFALLVPLLLSTGVRGDVGQYRSAVRAEPSLLSYYPFDTDAGTTVVDTVPPLQNGKVVGAKFSTAAGTLGAQSVQGGRVSLGPVPDYDFVDGSGTVELFLFQSGTAAYNPCFFAGRDDSLSPTVRYSLHGDTAGGHLYIWNGSAAPSVATPVNMVNQLVHVAFVFDAGTASVYFNGALIGTLNAPLGAALGRPFQIGASGPANQEAWVGRLDEVALYADALPGDAIAAHYAAFLTSLPGDGPLITSQPQSVVADPGDTVTFRVEVANPEGASFRWQANGRPVAGATNASITLGPVTSADDGAVYRCVIYNPFGGTNTAAATLAVRVAPTLVSEPEDAIRAAGEDLTLRVEASGSAPLAYQWVKDQAPIQDATNSSLSLPALTAANTGRYRVEVSNPYGRVTTAGAQVWVVPVAIVSPPVNAVQFPGGSAAFSVTATGAAPLTYQWFHDAALIPGATNATLTLLSLASPDVGAYSVVVGNGLGSTNSPPGRLTLVDPAVPEPLPPPPPFHWLAQDNGTLADAVVLFSEVMYQPASRDLRDRWVEVQNVMRADVDLSGWSLDGSLHFTFPPGTVLAGGGYLVVAADPAAVGAATGVVGLLGPFTDDPVDAASGHLVLRNHDGRMMDEMTFGTDLPWPAGAAGTGASLARARPLGASAEPRTWVASSRIGGSPGRSNQAVADAVPRLALNEVDASGSVRVRVELLNPGTNALALAGFTLGLRTPGGVTRVALAPVTLDGGAIFTFDGSGFPVHPAADDLLFLLGSHDTELVDAVVVKSRLRGRAPDGIGRWVHPAAATFGASNRVAMERSVVINEIFYAALPEYPGGVYTPPPGQWIELFNRGSNTVDLTGWRLDNGIRYAFPASTLIAPGGYLVVADDVPAFTALHPGVVVLGNFSGKLARSTDLVELKDAADNIVNEVRYYSAGRWPAYAAGGGSSLELVDPYADNRAAESWAASNESSRGAWQTVTYRMVAAPNKGYDVGDNLWREFVLGLLDAGEFDLDDVSVIESPGTPGARQLIQNGSFEGDVPGAGPAKWRVLGNHGLHGRTVVEVDPTNPANKVLHVVASGATDFLHNHLETTLKSGSAFVSVVAGREYEISYRARWIAGVRLVNTRLYANWCQRTTVLEVPPAHGTPGAMNSRRVASAGPTYTAFTHAPAVPPAGTPVTVSVEAYDPQGIESLRLFWRIDGAAWASLPMRPSPDPAVPHLFTGVLPGQAAGARVQFYVEGRDPLGGVSTYPADGVRSRALLVFDDHRADPPPGHTLRFVMTSADTDTLYFMTNRMSNERIGATVVYNESEVFYDVGVRLKGSAFGRDNDTETGLSIDFDPDHPFRGAHTSISVERGGSKRELLARFLFNQAGGGIAAGYDDVVQVLTPRVQDAGRCFISTTRTTDTMLSTEYGGGGTVYNLELLYTPTTTVNGNAEAPKLNFPYEHTQGAPDIQDLGDDKEVYRWNFQLRNNRTRDDSSLMLAVAKSFELGGAAMDGATRRVMDVDQWMRCFAMESLVGNDDFYTRLYNHNFRMYQRPADNRMVALPWDLDRAFNLPVNASLWGVDPDAFGVTNRMRKLIEYPGNLRVYYAHLRDLAARSFNTAYATRWATHFANLLGDSELLSYLPFITGRAAYVLGQIPAELPFAITTGGGLPVATASNLVTVAGTAPYAVRAIQVNGEWFDPVWTSPGRWSVTLALAAGSRTLAITGLDLEGNPVAGAVGSLDVTVTPAAPLDDPVGRVVINEIQYRPPQPGSEFVELYNRSATTAYDLAGWRLDGTGLTFDRGTTLAPGGFVVVAGSRAAVAAVYGGEFVVAEEFPERLDDAGETLSLVRPGVPPGPDLLVDRVRYEPAAPWAASANGMGQSLQLIDAAQDNARVSNWGDGGGWRYFTYTGKVSGSKLSLLFDNLGGDLFLDDLSLVAGSVAGVGPNLLTNPGFESPLAGTWTATGVATNSHRTNSVAHSGASSLHYIQALGSASATSFYQDILPALGANSTNTLSGWLLPSGSNASFSLRIGTPFQARPASQRAGGSPGARNHNSASLPPYPEVWLNELQPENIHGPLTAAGDHAPWVELVNTGDTPVALDGFHLSDDYSEPTRWAFPPGTTLPGNGFLVVWLDGASSGTGSSELHASFRPAPGVGSLALSRRVGDSVQIVDYLNYADVMADESYGDFPDGQPFYRQRLFYPTPGAANNGSSAPLVVFINEWMAANNSTLADPADGRFDDWFELYNPSSTPADLGGCFLTDNLADKFQYRVPNTGQYVIPPGGYLLVWADGTPSQNTPDRADLHVNFSLRAAGEAIGLFAPDGRALDTVTFGRQLDDVSMGRDPDGSAVIQALPNPTPRLANTTPVRPPAFTGIVLSQGVVTLTFSAQPGARYRLQSTEDLGTATWSDVPGDVTAPGSEATKRDPVGASVRFYRIMQLP